MVVLISLNIFSEPNDDDGVRSDNNYNNDAETTEAEALFPATGYNNKGLKGSGFSEPFPSPPATVSYSWDQMP